MIVSVYAVYDGVAEEYGAPFVSKNHKTAWKGFKTFLDAHKDTISEDDVSLFYIGSFNSDNGVIVGDTVIKISEEVVDNV